MRIQAKYPGTCWRCNRRFRAGTTVNWVRGGGSAHVFDCTPAGDQTPDRDEAPDREVEAGAARVREIQAISAPGSAFREELYRQMELDDFNRGLDG